MTAYRSALYVPASNVRAMDKARDLPADVILFDLEDAVAPDAKEPARATLAQALSQEGFARRLRVARINALNTRWGGDDARALAQTSCDAILLPKVAGARDVADLAALIGEKPIWVMMETPAGILAAKEICACPQVSGLVVGSNDLAKDLRARPCADRLPLMGALQMVLLAARAHGVIAIDGVYNNFKDSEGLRAECEQGRALGFDGKSLIHPAQLPVANQVFAPSPEDIDLAHRQIAAFEAAQAAGQGVAVLDGHIVENLHIETARATLRAAAYIQESESP